jgi:hypothetical protein
MSGWQPRQDTCQHTLLHRCQDESHARTPVNTRYSTDVRMTATPGHLSTHVTPLFCILLTSRFLQRLRARVCKPTNAPPSLSWVRWMQFTLSKFISPRFILNFSSHLRLGLSICHVVLDNIYQLQKFSSVSPTGCHSWGAWSRKKGSRH